MKDSHSKQGVGILTKSKHSDETAAEGCQWRKRTQKQDNSIIQNINIHIPTNKYLLRIEHHARYWKGQKRSVLKLQDPVFQKLPSGSCEFLSFLLYFHSFSSCSDCITINLKCNKYSSLLIQYFLLPLPNLNLLYKLTLDSFCFEMVSKITPLFKDSRIK